MHQNIRSERTCRELFREVVLARLQDMSTPRWWKLPLRARTIEVTRCLILAGILALAILVTTFPLHADSDGSTEILGRNVRFSGPVLSSRCEVNCLVNVDERVESVSTPQLFRTVCQADEDYSDCCANYLSEQFPDGVFAWSKATCVSYLKNLEGL